MLVSHGQDREFGRLSRGYKFCYGLVVIAVICVGATRRRDVVVFGNELVSMLFIAAV